MKSEWQLSDRMYQKEPIQRCELHACGGACCLYGVWVGLEERDKIIENWEGISPFMLEENRDVKTWFQDKLDQDQNFEGGTVVHTRIVPNASHYGRTACVFLAEESKCALQVASEHLGKHRWFFKPFYCILHPLDLDKNGMITLDEKDLLLAEEASCLRPAIEKNSLLHIFEEELSYLLGSEEYQKILNR